MIQAEQAEPPSRPLLRRPLFMVGQDERGNWVVQDEYGICGGLFVNRDAALRFVREENDRQPQAIVMISGILELDMSRKMGLAPHRELGADSEPQRRIA
jgi:hypothetical protein